MTMEEFSSPRAGVDVLFRSFENISSTQLFTLVVTLTVLVSVVLLGSSSDIPIPKPAAELPPPQRKPSDGPEVRWQIFTYVNVAIAVAFMLSVVEFARNASSYYDNALFLFLLSWSAFLAYFFGFFGISFVHQNMSGSEEELIEPVVTKSLEKEASAPVTKVHPPAQATPVCTDPVPVQKHRLPAAEIANLSDADIAHLVMSGKLKDHELEKVLPASRAVDVRRLVMQDKLSSLGHDNALANLPSEPSLDYSRVHGANCEIVVGYVPLPVGLVGPLTLNGESVYIPMATTEGCLVASTNRGAKAITAGSGADAVVLRDAITRAPCLRMPSAKQAAALAIWSKDPTNFERIKAAFESTTSFGKLVGCNATVAGKNVYLRLECQSGDAMGMNMVSKGSLAVIARLQEEFPEVELVALSGNMCTDKKAAATNWLNGRGKSVVVEATIPKDVVQKVLKTTVDAMVHTNINKNLIGSAMAGVIGGFNAHASNIVTAVFLASGQDPAQNVESSNCITIVEKTSEGDLWMSCTMPSIEVGTVGGGTSLPAQAACLEAMGVRGGNREEPGKNAQQLAMIVASATLAGEMSLLAALAANTLVQAHMKHNRKPQK